MASEELEDRVQRLQREVDSLLLKIPPLEEANATLLHKFTSLEAKYHDHMQLCVGSTSDVLGDSYTASEAANNSNDDVIYVSPAQPPACNDGQISSNIQHLMDCNKAQDMPVEPNSNMTTVIDNPSDPTPLCIKSEHVQGIIDSKVFIKVEPKIETKMEQLCSETLGQESQFAEASYSHSRTPSPLRHSVRPNLRLRVEVVLPPVPRHWRIRGSKKRISKRNPSSHAPETEEVEPRLLGSGQHPNNGPPEKRNRLAFLPVADSMSELADSELLDRSEDNDGDPNVTVYAIKKYKTGDTLHNLPTMSLFERLAAAGIAPLEVNVATKLLDATITRKFLSNICGGRMQSTFSDPDAKREYGKNRSAKTFVRLVQEFNGYAPQKPGMPGLFFGNSRYHIWPVSQEQVFTRLRSGNWLYQGDYKFIRCQSMTCAEYLLQTDGFRTSWSTRCQSAKWATYIRATIALRQELHREPTGIEVDARIAAIAADRSIDKVTADQIDTAFALGEEVIGIWAMKCVGYDASFKHTMIEQFNNWASLSEPENIRCEPGKKSHTRRTKMQAYPCSNSKVRRRQRIAPPGAAGASGHINAYEANVGHNELTQ